MRSHHNILVSLLALWLATGIVRAQVYSPKILVKGQVDTHNLAEMTKSIYEKAGALTPRQKAEAIWRFFLTDGRFVAPGFWYHIAGWTYEEPQGEVLDPLKLLNSYGFGLCYHLAPLLEAAYEAGGFADARVWFLTGHTVAEVYYDGAYHHYDSDMMGYTSVGDGDPKAQPVASVSQIVGNGRIMLSKLKSPTEVDPSRVDYPWYPADLREAAIGDLASVFTSQQDNWLYHFTRYSQAHSMDSVLRPGERLIRYFQPESKGLFYLPFRSDGKSWNEFPREIAAFGIRTEDGPRSQKDVRYWATGRIEYQPVLWDQAAYYSGPGASHSTNLRFPGSPPEGQYLSREKAHLPAQAVFEMQSSYVLIDALVTLEALLQESGQAIQADISVDGGASWEEMARLVGPYRGRWQAQPSVKVRSQYGNFSAISGKYHYLVRLNMIGPGQAEGIQLRNIQITSRFQLNPRTLPELIAGQNELAYRPGMALRRSVFPLQLDRLSTHALRAVAVRYVLQNGQGILWPAGENVAEMVFALSAPDGSPLCGFDVGARFLDLRDNLAPDKLTAEIRATSLGQKPPADSANPEASMAWSVSPAGEYTTLWEYNPVLQWKDGESVDRVLRWPEVDRQIRALPAEIRKVYLRFRLKGMGLDSPRWAILIPYRGSLHPAGALEITHLWSSKGQPREHVERIENAQLAWDYRIDIPPGEPVANHAVIFSCPPAGKSK